jgi:hypothetical protein
MSNKIGDRETVIWTISFVGNSFFIVDLWEISKSDKTETLDSVKSKRIVASSVNILKMTFSNIKKTRVNSYEVLDLQESEEAFTRELRLYTEEGEIVVRAVSIFELDGPPVLVG